MGYAMNFGLGSSAGDFGAGGEEPEDPNEPFLQRIMRLKEARDRLQSSGYGSQEPPPDAVSIPRVQAQAENPSFFSKNPGLGKGVDAAIGALALLSNLRAQKRNKASGYRGHQTSMVDISGMPTVTGKLKAEREKRRTEDLKVQGQNVSAAEAEAKINESAMSRWATRRNAEMGQVMPSIARASMREPGQGKAPPVYQQKLETLRNHPAYLEADPKRRNEMELHVIGAEPKTPQDTVTDYNRAMARLQAKLDFQKKNPGAAGGKDIGEIDIADMAKYMQGLIVNDFDTPEHAADMALEYGRNKMKLREAVGKDPTFTPGAMGPGAGAAGIVPPPVVGGAPGAPAPARPSGPLSPTLQHKLEVYKRFIVVHPERRDQLRQDILATEGVDPDVYLGTGQ